MHAISAFALIAAAALPACSSTSEVRPDDMARDGAAADVAHDGAGDVRAQDAGSDMTTWDIAPDTTPSYDDVYFVTQAGGGGDGGDGTANDPYSVAQFNALEGDFSGDVFYFSGAISSTVAPRIFGAPGHPVTLDGYEPDDSTHADLSESKERALIDRDDASNSVGLEVDVAYVDMQDFAITRCDDGGIRIDDGAHDVTVRRTFIYECQSGITLGSTSEKVTIGGARGQGNVIKNVGTTTADEDIALSSTHDVIISYNHLYADDAQWGIDGVLAEGNVYNVLVEYNWIHGHNRHANGEDGIDLKRGTVHDVVVRYNNIYDHTYQSCMTFQSSVHEIYAYGNLCRDAENGLITGDDDHGGGNDNIYFFGNIVYDIEEVAMAIGTQGVNGAVFIHNNTLAHNGYCVDQYGVGECRPEPPGNSTAWGHVRVQDLESDDTRSVIKNNIFYMGRPSQTDYRQFYVHQSDAPQTTSDYNLFHWPSNPSTMYWGDEGYTDLAGLQGADPPREQHSTDEDPGLMDPDQDDYRIASAASAVYGSGEALGSGNIATLMINGSEVNVPWGFALGPNTRWEGIPTIDEVSFVTLGRWDRGAYAFMP